MPKYISPSPIILDQSFPRTNDELLVVANALAIIQDLLDNREVYLIVPETFKEWIEQVDWEPPRDYALLVDVYRYLSNLFIMQNESVLDPILDNIITDPHPIPTICTNESWLDIWALEMGKLLKLHDQASKDGEYFIGIACALGFAGKTCAAYCEDVARAFPHVDNITYKNLSPPYEWSTSIDIVRKDVTFALAKRNCKFIGAESVNEAVGTSHYKVNFKGYRCWTLDKNVDPVPDNFLAELIPITGYPLNVIKQTLITGDYPRKRSRIPLREDPFLKEGNG